MADRVSLHTGALDGATTGAGSTGVLAPRGNKIAVLVSVSAIGGTSPSYTFSVQWSENGTTWHDAEPAENFTEITAVKSVVKLVERKGSYMRLYRVVTGTDPTATVAVEAMGVYDPS